MTEATPFLPGLSPLRGKPLTAAEQGDRDSGDKRRNDTCMETEHYSP